MSAANFLVETLVFPGVFPRGLARSTQSPEDRLQIVVNKYTPRNNPNPQIGDVTLTMAHANGFHKVTFEYRIEKTYFRNCMSLSLMPFLREVNRQGCEFVRYGFMIWRIRVLQAC